MPDLRIDFGLLEAMQRSLDSVVRQFDGLSAHDAAESRIWGGSSVCSAVGQFAENWRTHRRKLSEDARKLAEQCSGTAEVFRAVDAELGRAAQGPPPR